MTAEIVLNYEKQHKNEESSACKDGMNIKDEEAIWTFDFMLKNGYKVILEFPDETQEWTQHIANDIADIMNQLILENIP